MNDLATPVKQIRLQARHHSRMASAERTNSANLVFDIEVSFGVDECERDVRVALQRAVHQCRPATLLFVGVRKDRGEEPRSEKPNWKRKPTQRVTALPFARNGTRERHQGQIK